MKFTKYIPYLLAVALFFAGRLTTHSPDKELINRFETERKVLTDSIMTKNVKIMMLTKRSEEIRRKMVEDSIASARRLQENHSAYLKLKRSYDKINLRSASTAELDSLRASLYPR